MSTVAWRRTWFQVHKWIGLTLAILIVPLSLSGAALVWHDGLDRLVNPSRYAVTGDALLSADAYLAAAHGEIGVPAVDPLGVALLPPDVVRERHVGSRRNLHRLGVDARARRRGCSLGHVQPLTRGAARQHLEPDDTHTRVRVGWPWGGV